MSYTDIKLNGQSVTQITLADGTVLWKKSSPSTNTFTAITEDVEMIYNFNDGEGPHYISSGTTEVVTIPDGVTEIIVGSNDPCKVYLDDTAYGKSHTFTVEEVAGHTLKVVGI